MENKIYTFLTSDDVKMNKTIMLNGMFKKTHEYLSNEGIKLSATCMNRCVDLCLRVILSCKDPNCYNAIITDLNYPIEYNSSDPFFSKKDYMMRDFQIGDKEKIAFKKILQNEDIDKVFSAHWLEIVRNNSDTIIDVVGYFIDIVFRILMKELEFDTVNVLANIFTYEDTRVRFRYGYRKPLKVFIIDITSNIVAG